MEDKYYFQLNMIQHFVFCKRQWALMEIEQCWEENVHTRIGHYTHELVDDPFFREKRKGKLITRSVPLVSNTLGVRGIADVIEYISFNDGIEIAGTNGKWLPQIVEYKKGKPKNNISDIAQLTLQVICFEEMTGLSLSKGYLYYKQINRRVEVNIDATLRKTVLDMLKEMRRLYEAGITPPAEKNKNCQQCSLVNYCMPRWTKKVKSVNNYLSEYLGETYEKVT